MNVTPSLIKSNVDLAPYNTLNIHATARHFALVNSIDSLQYLLDHSEGRRQPVYILGGGSNVLFISNFEGLVIRIAIEGREIIQEDDQSIWLTIGAGENWHDTVRYCVHKGWGGIENLSLIPGTVGAAPIQNIGAYGVELQDVFECLTAIEIETGKIKTFDKQECQFGYRDSIFKKEWKGRFVVTAVTLKLSKNPQLNTSYGAIQQKLREKHITEPTIVDISDIVIEIRNSKLPNPREIANAGSFFKNPMVRSSVYKKLKKRYPSMPGYQVDQTHTKVPAGWLIEQAGWKGREIGNTGTYQQQALVIVNHGGATGQEILALSQRIQQAVCEKFEIELVPEVNIVT